MKHSGGHSDQVDVTEIDQLGAFFKRMPVAMYRSSPDGELQEANPALARLLGYESVEALRAALSSVTGLYVDPAQRAAWVEQVAHLGVVLDFDVELRRADGSSVWVRDSARVIRDERGRALFYEGVLIDVTDKVRAQEAKDEFIATVSHELRNPIAVMLGLGEELADHYDSFDDVERRDIAKLIARQAEDAGWLIEDLLVAYREDVSAVVVQAQRFDVIKEVERVLEVIDHPIEVQVRGGTSDVWADPRRTRQILRNLVSNAQRYGGTTITVLIQRAGDRLEIKVRDTGDPIGDTEVDRIFHPFERGTGKTHPKSVGLGLSVARKLARLMEGDLVYRHEQGWSTFVLSLPTA